MCHNKTILQAAQDYYNNLFYKEGEDYYDMRRMASAPKNNNPQHLKGKTEV